MAQSPNPSATKTIAVVGAGTMGGGIAQELVRHGFAVLLRDVSREVLDRAAERISRGLAHEVEKGRLKDSDRQQALARLRITIDWTELGRADFAIETVTEKFDMKALALQTLERQCRPEAIFASNTSSISITRLAATTNRPKQVVGMHFFNPVPVMKLVEVISGLETSPATLQAAEALARSLGKTTVRANDFPGFVSNRVLMPMINEAIFALMEGVAEARGIDEVMKLGMNHPMGPLELADFIGLDVCLDIMKVLYEGFRDSKYRPCPLLEKMVAAGRLGRKSGRGFYEYSPG